MPPTHVAPAKPRRSVDHEIESQINVPPCSRNRLWKVIVSALRCPACGSTRHRAETGKRRNADEMLEQYRRCRVCQTRFRTVFE